MLILGFLWREWCWSWNSSTLATSCEELTHWKRLWCWEGLGARGEGDDRGWDGWMASLTRWTWVWVNSRSWWLTGRPGVLQFMGSQRVGHDWATELNWTNAECIILFFNWRKIALQYCVGFCHTTTQFSHDYTYIASLLRLKRELNVCFLNNLAFQLCADQVVWLKVVWKHIQKFSHSNDELCLHLAYIS